MLTKHLSTILILSLSIISLSASAQQQEPHKKEKVKLFKNYESRKELIQERDSLRRVIEELRNMMAIELSDTLSVEDTINPGGMEIMTDDIITDSLAFSTDSLLSMWYQQRDLSSMEIENFDLDSAEILSDIPDSLLLQRLQKMNSFISIPYNKVIRNHILYYAQKMPDKMETILGLSNYYMPIFEEIFDQYDLPKELKAMAIIESALNPKAVSRVKARGMWQFMYGTAKRYGLVMNSFVDERYDPIASGHAAAKYLRDSYLIFGDWTLAIASYNCGAGNVNKAIRRSGGSKDFWDIYPYLPRETRGYVPSFVAALYTLSYYKEHSLTPKPTSMPPHTDTLRINKMLHFEQVSHFTGVTVDELRKLNPQYMFDIVPGVEREYILRIPYNYTNNFVNHEKELYSYNDTLYFNPGVLKKIKETDYTSSQRIVHTVKSGQTLGHIALKYHVKVSSIQRWNGIGTNIRIGQKLVIYTNGSGPAATGSTNKQSSTSRSSTSKSSTSSSPKTTNADGYVYYTVRKGDTLWDISKMFPGVSVNDIMVINGMTSSPRIYPGAKIKIKKI